MVESSLDNKTLFVSEHYSLFTNLTVTRNGLVVQEVRSTQAIFAAVRALPASITTTTYPWFSPSPKVPRSGCGVWVLKEMETANTDFFGHPFLRSCMRYMRIR
jgi:hypothetical protein